MSAAFPRRLVAAAGGLFAANAVLACGYCVEDRVAAVYDHALTQLTHQRKHQLAFFSWDGPIARDEVSRRKIVALAESVAGVDKGSVRVALEPAAIAVAFDPRRGSASSIAVALQQRLGVLKLSVLPLQTPFRGSR